MHLAVVAAMAFLVLVLVAAHDHGSNLVTEGVLQLLGRNHVVQDHVCTQTNNISLHFHTVLHCVLVEVVGVHVEDDGSHHDVHTHTTHTHHIHTPHTHTTYTHTTYTTHTHHTHTHHTHHTTHTPHTHTTHLRTCDLLEVVGIHVKDDGARHDAAAQFKQRVQGQRGHVRLRPALAPLLHILLELDPPETQHATLHTDEITGWGREPATNSQIHESRQAGNE